jgi:hypothetical protein
MNVSQSSIEIIYFLSYMLSLTPFHITMSLRALVVPVFHTSGLDQKLLFRSTVSLVPILEGSKLILEI